MASNTRQNREPRIGSSKWSIGFALVLIVFLGATSCSKKAESTDNETASPETTETANASPSPGASSPTETTSPTETASPTQTGAIPSATRPHISVPPTLKLKPVSKFRGRWINVDRKTTGVTRLMIQPSGDQMSVRVFYKCKQGECDYGSEKCSASGDECPLTFDRGTQGTIKIALKLQGELLQAHVGLFSSDGKPYVESEQFFKKQ
jgi:hypothetical protein